jgi:hypothetical protein
VLPLSLSLAGCGGGSHGGNCTANLQMSWQIDSNVTCESVGATTVEVILDGASSTVACNTYGTTIGGLLPGTHTAQVQLKDAGGTVISDTGAMTIAINSCITYDLNGGSPIVFATNTPPCTTADLQVSWSIEDTTGATLTCAQTPADTVQVIIDGTVYPFGCSTYMGQVSNIPLGTHTAQLKLLDNGTTVSDTGAMSVSLSSCILYDLNGGTPVPFTVN